MAFFLTGVQIILTEYGLDSGIAYAADSRVIPGSLRNEIRILQRPPSFFQRALALVRVNAGRVAGNAIRGASRAAVPIWAGYEVINAYKKISDALKGVGPTPCLPKDQQFINVTDQSLHEDSKLIMAPEKFGIAEEQIIREPRNLILNFGVKAPLIIQKNNQNNKIILMHASRVPSSYRWFPVGHPSGDIKVGGTRHRGLSYTEVKLVRYNIYVEWTNRRDFEAKGLSISDNLKNGSLIISASPGTDSKAVTLGQVFTDEILNAGLPFEFEAAISSVWQPTHYIINPGSQIGWGGGCSWDKIKERVRQDQTLEIGGPALGISYTKKGGAQERPSQFTPTLTVTPVIDGATDIAELSWTGPEITPDKTPNFLVKRVAINQSNGLPDPQSGTYITVPDGDFLEPSSPSVNGFPSSQARVVAIRNIPSDDPNWEQRYGFYIKAEYNREDNAQLGQSKVQEVIFKNEVNEKTGEVETKAEKGVELDAPSPTEESGGSVTQGSAGENPSEDQCSCKGQFDEFGIFAFVFEILCKLLCLIIDLGLDLSLWPAEQLFKNIPAD